MGKNDIREQIRILYIDDNPMDRALVRDSLEKEHSGFVLSEAASKDEFEKEILENSFDLVLTDFNILGFEGLSVLEKVKQIDPDIPVIIVTGTGSETVAVESMKAGAADYLIKTPEHIKKLPQSILKVLKFNKYEKERVQALRKLTERERFVSTLLNAIPIPVFYKDKDGRYLGVNRSFEKFFGKINDEIVGKSVFEISPVEIAYIYDQKDKELYKTGGDQVYESKLIDKDGQQHDVVFFKSIFSDEEGSTAGLIGAIMDITSRKQSEMELKKYQDHLEELIRERTADLEEKNNELERFNKLFVDRELRMKEISDRNKVLEMQIEELKNKK